MDEKLYQIRDPGTGNIPLDNRNLENFILNTLAKSGELKYVIPVHENNRKKSLRSTMEKYFNEMSRRYPALAEVAPLLKSVAEELTGLFKRGNTLFLAGNGGSAADAEHICGELLKGFKSKRELSEEDKQKLAALSPDKGAAIANSLQYGLRAVSLLSHPALTSAFGNDVDPELAFAQQLWALGRDGDAVIGISTGGNAGNICKLFIAARAKNIRTILLTGSKNGCCREFADVVLAVPETETYKIQELHLPLYHTLCLALESQFFKMME